MTRVPLVVAADGGNSKTDLVLATVDGDVVARRQLRGTQPHLGGGLAGVATLLADGVRDVLVQADRVGERPLHGVFCLANVDLPEEETETAALLRAHDVIETVDVQNDILAVLRAGTERTWGVAVVAGAGVNAVGVHPDGRVHRFLAMGDFTGDWGGGLGLGAGALGAAIRAIDGRGAPTSLGPAIAAAMGRPSAYEVALAVHRGEILEWELIALAPLVLEAAAAGDHAALALVERLVGELHDFVSASVARLDLAALAPDVVLGGGVLQSDNRIVSDGLTQRLSDSLPRATAVVLDVAPVTGALATALRHVGAAPTAVAHARTQLASAGRHA